MKYIIVFCMIVTSICVSSIFAGSKKDLQICIQSLPKETKQQMHDLIGYQEDLQSGMSSHDRQGVYDALYAIWKYAKLPGTPNQHRYKQYYEWINYAVISRPASAADIIIENDTEY